MAQRAGRDDTIQRSMPKVLVAEAVRFLEGASLEAFDREVFDFQVSTNRRVFHTGRGN